MKRIFLVALAVLFVFAAAACTGDPNAGNVVEVPDSATPLPDNFLETATPSTFRTKQAVDYPDNEGTNYAANIMVSELDDDQLKVSTMMSIDWDYIVDQKEGQGAHQYNATKIWEATYGGTVTIRTVPENEMTSSLSAWSAAGEAPDIIPSNNANYPLWPQRGLTSDMKWYGDNLDITNGDIFNRDLMELYSWKGEHPYAITNTATHYYYVVFNKTLFDRKGEKTPWDYWQEGNWTWTQFVQTAKAMTEGEEAYGFTGWGLFPYQAPYPMAAVSDDGIASLNIDNPNYIRYMTEVYNFYQTEKAGRSGWNLQDWSTLMPQNTDAMVITNLSSFERMWRIIERRDTGADLRVAPLYVFDPNDEAGPITPTSFWGYAIARQAKAPYGAAEYIRLESLVSRAIFDERGGHSWLPYVTPEEKAMIEEYEKNVTMVIEPIQGVGDCYAIIDGQMVPSIYYDQAEVSVQAVFDSIRPILNAEFDAFNAGS